MSTLKAKDLSKIGYTNDQARSLVINIASRHFKHHSKDELIALLTDIKAHPENYVRDEVTGKIAEFWLQWLPRYTHLRTNTLRPGFTLLVVQGQEPVYTGWD